MDGTEQVLFARTVGRAMERQTGAELDAALDALGWQEALHADPRSAVSILFDRQGRSRVGSSALGHVLVSALGVAAADVVLPPLGRSSPPGDLQGRHLSVHGLGFASLGSSSTAVVVARTATDASAHLVAVHDLDLRPIGGIDPELGLVEVTGRVEVTGLADPARLSAADWPAAVALGRMALGHELVGAARTMLHLAREHALERVQFGRPIAMFQAVRHRLADTLVSIEAAEALLGAAWDDCSATTAAMAKAASGRAARTAARHCQQVLAGIGFTTEHPFQGYVRRTLVLDQLLGSAPALAGELGQALLGSRRLPDLLPL